jgi:hypothetical protein
VQLEGTIGEGDGGVAHGAALIRFAEAATRGSEDLADARAALLQAVGGSGFIEAAATVGVFNGLVRVADSTGIPLDDGTRANTGEFRESLGLNAYGSAANTDLSVSGGEAAAGAGVGELFAPK